MVPGAFGACQRRDFEKSRELEARWTQPSAWEARRNRCGHHSPVVLPAGLATRGRLERLTNESSGVSRHVVARAASSTSIEDLTPGPSPTQGYFLERT